MNDSKKKDPKFWKRWRMSGAIGGYPKKTPINPFVSKVSDFIRITANGKTTLIFEDTEKITNNVQVWNLIGTATGMDLFHCIYIAQRHTLYFLERVSSYTIKEAAGDPNSVEVSFYECKM